MFERVFLIHNVQKIFQGSPKQALVTEVMQGLLIMKKTIKDIYYQNFKTTFHILHTKFLVRTLKRVSFN